MFSIKKREWYYFLQSIMFVLHLFLSFAIALFWWMATVTVGKCTLPELINWTFTASVLECFLWLWKKKSGEINLETMYIWLSISEVYVLWYLAPFFFFWAYGKAEHHGRQCLVRKSCSLHSNQEEGSGGDNQHTKDWTKDTLQGHDSSDLVESHFL